MFFFVKKQEHNFVEVLKSFNHKKSEQFGKTLWGGWFGDIVDVVIDGDGDVVVVAAFTLRIFWGLGGGKNLDWVPCLHWIYVGYNETVCLFVCLCPVLTKTRSKVQLLLLRICQRPAEAEAERISINLVLCCSSAWIEFSTAAKKKTLSVHFFILLWFNLRYEKCKFNYLVLDFWFRGLGTSKLETLDIFATNLVHQRLKQFRNL